MPIPSRDDVKRGILYINGAVLVFSGMNVATKWLVASYPVVEIMFFRCLFALIPCAILVAFRGGLPSLRTRRLSDHAARAASQFLGMASIFIAFGMMPLADVIAISFAAPLFMTLLSIPILGERVGIHRWGAVLVGFIGVLIMVQPGPGVLESGALFALGNALFTASSTIGLRRMSVTESTDALITYQMAIIALLSAVALPFLWVTPRWADLAIMLAIGLGSGINQFFWTQAFRYAPAAVASPFTYGAMVWAILLGYLIWGELPTAALLLGAVIVVASGLYILYRETIRRAAARAPGPGDD